MFLTERHKSFLDRQKILRQKDKKDIRLKTQKEEMK